MSKGLRNAMIVAVGAFFLAIIVSTVSQNILNLLPSTILAFIVLLIIIFIGIIFDIIGVAVAVASETPFHSRAAKKVVGSKQAIYLVRNADKVANFCADVIGDISGTLSGAIGAAIIFKILHDADAVRVWTNTIMTAFVAALTIGGKAWGKKFAMDEAHEIIFQVGKILAWLEKATGLSFLETNGKKGRKV